MILVGTTLATFAMDQRDTWSAWLRTWVELVTSVDEPVKCFAAIQTDARGIEPFRPLTDALETFGGSWWDYRLDDGRTEVTTANRLLHLTTGQNLVTARAVQDPACTHLLFLAADCCPPGDILPKLLELDHPYCAPYIPTYGLRGEPAPVVVPDGDGWRTVDCERAMPSAAAVLLHRSVFNRLRWRFDPVAGLSDDPALMRDAVELLGISPLVRMDCEARHYPEAIGPVETRGHDMEVHR